MLASVELLKREVNEAGRRKAELREAYEHAVAYEARMKVSLELAEVREDEEKNNV